MAKIRDIMAAKLNVQSDKEFAAQAATDRKRREVEEMMGVRRETYQRVGRRVRRKR
ncbi:hypothetical protein [Terribacillus saccharophilus]|uniref:hypothetical protein n=1 Tax=Terribacillus saccharophilus TaxID=361277 RepID=UPI001482EE62|nr:hypothetical protein [Terribacillus saccharophilus]